MKSIRRHSCPRFRRDQATGAARQHPQAWTGAWRNDGSHFHKVVPFLLFFRRHLLPALSVPQELLALEDVHGRKLLKRFDALSPLLRRELCVVGQGSLHLLTIGIGNGLKRLFLFGGRKFEYFVPPEERLLPLVIGHLLP